MHCAQSPPALRSQLHVKLPAVFLQTLLAAQLWSPLVHSLMSAHESPLSCFSTTRPLRVLLHEQLKPATDCVRIWTTTVDLLRGSGTS